MSFLLLVYTNHQETSLSATKWMPLRPCLSGQNGQCRLFLGIIGTMTIMEKARHRNPFRLWNTVTAFRTEIAARAMRIHGYQRRRQYSQEQCLHDEILENDSSKIYQPKSSKENKQQSKRTSSTISANDHPCLYVTGRHPGGIPLRGSKILSSAARRYST